MFRRLVFSVFVLACLAVNTSVFSQNVDVGDSEADKMIDMALSGAVDASLRGISQHTYTILDVSPTVEFEEATSEEREGVSEVQIRVILSWATSSLVTVDYNVTGGTAVNGEDFSLAFGTLEFDPCEVTQYISVTIFEDEYDEDPDETVEITLSNATNAELGGIIQHILTILPPAVQVCPSGDMDGDCDVDYNDVRIFSGQWLEPSGGCSGLGCGDIDGINGVNMHDFSSLASTWYD